MGITCFADPDKRRTKNKSKKTFSCFLRTLVQRLIAASVAVTYKDKIRVEEKKENHMVDIK
jgi:hypothetical protein